MDIVIPDLYASKPEPLGFGPSLEIRAFLLRREGGNLLVYRSAMTEADAPEINDLGGISRQYLNHHHEASPACDQIAEAFDALLHIHEADAQAASEICNSWMRPSRSVITWARTSRSSPHRDTRPGRLPSCGTRGNITPCSPETRSSSFGADRGRRCSTASATGSGTPRAWG